jgi:glycosyltransferase involved in cell wall biosynthesis
VSLRLLMLAPASAVHAQRWANGLANLGIEVHLASLTEHPAPPGTIDDRVTLHALAGGGQRAYFSQAPAFARLAQRLHPDVVNAHYASGYGTTLMLSRQQPSVLSTWGSDVFEFPDRGPVHRRLVTTNLRFPRTVTSSSEVMADRIATVTNGRVTARVIPFGVDTVLFHPGPMPCRADRPLRFGIVKTMEAHYRIDLVIEAFAAYLAGQGATAASLDIYGGGPLLEDLRVFAATRGISDQVTFHGAIPHAAVPQALRAMDVFLLSSETESFGVAAVEAMACGIPVLASDAPGFVEVLDHGRYGRLYPRGDAAALTRLMAEVGGDIDVRRALRRAGLAGASRYDWRRNVADMAELIGQTAEQG